MAGMHFLILVSWMFAPSAVLWQRQDEPAKGRIEGVVVHQDSSQPISKAEVHLVPVPPALTRLLGISPPIRSDATTGDRLVRTDSKGIFSFKDLPADNYHLFIVAPGYAAQEYGQTAPNSQGTPISLKPNQRLEGLRIRLMPTGVIRGKISNESGEPVTGYTVEVFRVGFGPQGKTYQLAATTVVDDRGEYRLYGIAPGQYYFSTGSDDRSRGFQGPPSIVNHVARQFYPGVADWNQAIPISVTPGSEIPITMEVRTDERHRVQGRVIYAVTGRPPQRANIYVTPQSIEGAQPGRLVVPNRDYNPATGTFEISGVPPGSYIITAQFQDATMLGREDAWLTFPSGRAEFTVLDRDVDGVELILQKPASIVGNVRIRNSAAAPQGRVGFIPLSEGLPKLPEAKVGSDGTFLAEGMLPGESYRVYVNYLPQGLYVKSVSLDGSDILTSPFRFSSSNGTMEIVLQPGLAQLAGTVSDDTMKVVSNAYVVLVPEQRTRAELYRVIRSDQSGGFILSGVIPGDYKIFAWDEIEAYAYFDPTFLQKFEYRGTRIQVGDSSNLSVELQMIRNR